MLAAAAHRRDDLYEEHETVLLDAAATVEVQDFPQAMRRWVSLADDVMARRDAAFGFDRRGFMFSPTSGGRVTGFPDPEAARTITNVLDDLQPPEGPADTRSIAQRRFDALVLLCERAPAARCPTRDHRGRRTRRVRGHPRRPPLTDLAAFQCDIEGFGPIPRVTAERLLCDCAVGGRDGRRRPVLDLGRRTRTVPDGSGGRS